MAFENDSEKTLFWRMVNALVGGGGSNGPGIAGTAGAATKDVSTSIATSGTTANVVFNANQRVEVINSSASTLWASWGATPVVNGAGSFPIVSNGSFAPGYGVTGTLQLLSTVATQNYTVNRYA